MSVDDIESWARALAHSLPPGVQPVEIEVEPGVVVTVRRLARAMGGKDGYGTSLQPTGGVGASVRIEACAHNMQWQVIERRLGPGWTPGQLEAMLRGMIQAGSALHRLRRSRDELWAHLRHEEMMGDSDELEMAMAQEAAQHGYEDILEEMSEEDVRYWLWWLPIWRGARALRADWNVS